MKLVFILSLLIGASLLVGTDAGWFKRTIKKIGHKIADVFSIVGMPHPKIHSVRGYLVHKASGLYLNTIGNGYVHLQPGKSNKAYYIYYKESKRIYASHQQRCLYKRGDSVFNRRCEKAWRVDGGSKGNANKFSYKFDNRGYLLQLKNIHSGQCLHPKDGQGKQVRPGTLLEFRDCSPKSYIFLVQDYRGKEEDNPDVRKRRSHSNISKRKASSHGHSKRKASSHDRDRRSGSA